ncbi:MAG TPA: glycerophosphodiester phosphodiesterase family protein [Naasia sp.]
MVRTAFFDEPRPRIIAHRGLALDALENTLPAFRAAVAAGAQILETDAHTSRDGVAVLLHDPELKRIAGLDAPVSSLTLAELQAIDPVAVPICTLIDALRELPDARFNIDVKSPEAANAVSAAIRDAGAEERVLVASFSSARRRAALASLGPVATSASARELAVAIPAAKSGALPLLRRALRTADAVQLPARALGMSTATARMIRRFHAAGVEVHIWTVNDPDEMRRLLAAGVDGIVTDRADLLAEVVRQHN